MNSVGHGPPIAAILVGLVLTLAMLVPFVIVGWRSHRARLRLRACPCCGARATRSVHGERWSSTRMRVAVQCGQCLVWRRIVVEDSDHDAHHRRLARDRRAMARRLRRLEASRPAPEGTAGVDVTRSG